MTNRVAQLRYNFIDELLNSEPEVNSMDELRRDTRTADAVREAMLLLTEFGYDKARAHLEATGVETTLALQLLSLRFDRRASTSTPTRAGVGIFRGFRRADL